MSKRADIPESKVIPFSAPSLGEDEVRAVAEALRSGAVGGDGPLGKALALRMGERFGIRHVLLTPSATHALELALQVADIGPDDEVVLPSFTFVSVANAVLRRGARPVFAEISDATLDLDPDRLEEVVTPRTRAVIPAHYGGVGAPMERYQEIAGRQGIRVIEDAAQGLGARRGGRWLGGFGDMAGFSFHETKNLTCGEGGAFLTQRDDLFKRAEVIYEKGTNRSQFFRGEVDKYTWIGPGGSYVLSDILAALLGVQLDRMEALHAARRRVFERYQAGLSDLAREGKLQLPVIPDVCEPNWHVFYVRLPSGEERDRVLAEMRRRGIMCTFHFVPLHSSPFGSAQLGYREGDLPVTEAVSRTLLRLPLHAGLTDEDVSRVIEAMGEVVRGR
ncbi:MAG: dTDP-4-amino-4,6-dideoxygalactose transaminase [Deltaproteobacteria bacterium]|nr:dTDP-4-amino-4,6-dideoxygalactose transaminase [Deltaproteobacteria bacterium]